MTTVRAGLIQFALNTSTEESPETIKDNMIEAHLPLIDEAGENGVQILCLQEVFNQPYFCPSQDVKWYAAVEPIPDGPTTRLMQEYAKKHAMVIVVPIYEEEQTGVYYPDRRAGFLAARFRPSAGPSGHAGSSIWAAGESLTRQRSGAGGLFVMVGSSPARWARATPSGAVPGPPCRVELSRRGQPGADAGGGMARWIRRRAARRWAPAPPSTRVTRRP